MGNTDEDLLAPPEADPKVPPPHPAMAEVNAWVADQLTAKDEAYLETFEPTVEVPLPGQEAPLLCFHGSPRSNVDVLLPTTPADDVAEMMGGAGFAVGAGGHTHQPMVRRLGERLLVNPGSVGLPFLGGTGPDPVAARKPPWAEWALLEAEPGGGLSVDLRRTRYDLAAYEESVRASGMPAADAWLENWG